MRQTRNLAEFEQKATDLWDDHGIATGKKSGKPKSWMERTRTFAGFAFGDKKIIGDELPKLGYTGTGLGNVLGLELDIIERRPLEDLPYRNKTGNENDLIRFENDELPLRREPLVTRAVLDLLSIGVTPLTEEGTVASARRHFTAGDNKQAYLAVALAEAYKAGVTINLAANPFASSVRPVEC